MSAEERKPPPPGAWERAPALIPVASPAEPALISDGGGLPFTPVSAFGAGEPLDAADPAVGALLEQLELGRRRAQPRRLLGLRSKPAPIESESLLAGWRQLARTDDEALFGRGHPPHLLTVAAARRGRGERWTPLGASNSRPLRAVRDGVRASSWRLDPTAPPDPHERELRMLVTELTMATGAAVADRLLEPELFLDDERALLRLYVRPLEGYVGRSARRETPVIVQLPEPLGARQVVDGAVYEPPPR